MPSAWEIFRSDVQNGAGHKEKEFKFFSSIRLRNGVIKTTDRDRMRDVDEQFVGLLSAKERLEILDVGVSSGITTVELCEALDAKNLSYHVTAMDSDITAFILTYPKGGRVVVDKLGFAIHFEMNGKGFGYVKGTNLKLRLDLAAMRFRTRWYLNSKLKGELADAAVSGNGDVDVRRIDLVCREVLENPSITLLEDSVFAKGNEKAFDLIRAANILNLAYFSEAQLTEALGNLKSRLKNGGFLWICRTAEDRANNATLFTLEAEKFRIVSRFGAGSEVEHLVLGV